MIAVTMSSGNGDDQSSDLNDLLPPIGEFHDRRQTGPVPGPRFRWDGYRIFDLCVLR
jgi:hypothetical protein